MIEQAGTLTVSLPVRIPSAEALRGRLGRNSKQTLPPLTHSVWQATADGFVWCVCDSNLMRQHSAEGLFGAFKFRLASPSTEESIHLWGWSYRLLTSLPIPHPLLKGNWSWQPIAVCRWPSCQLHRSVSPRIANYEERPLLDNQPGRRKNSTCPSVSREEFWLQVHPKPSKHTVGS